MQEDLRLMFPLDMRCQMSLGVVCLFNEYVDFLFIFLLLSSTAFNGNELLLL